ncbi:MAG: dihydropteroate synthase [Fibrobacter sp.]|nr:dihydropteroate synthase [Fibrobacter sp.]
MFADLLNSTSALPWKIGNTVIPAKRMPLLMGIVNVTPDSFFDGGKHNSPADAFEHAIFLVEQGADILDIGGESSRPGSAPVSEQEELDRVCPVVESLAQFAHIAEISGNNPRKFFISVDTTKAKVAEECMRLGANIINDISACQMDAQMPAVVARTQAAVVLNHMRGNFGTMQQDFKPYANVVAEVCEELDMRAKALITAGVEPSRICIDPGIGFGKSVQDNIDLMKSLDRMLQLGYPVLLGSSRKSYISGIHGLENSDRLIPTVSAGLIAALQGVSALRVHDVREAKESILYLEALKSNGTV